LFTGLRQGEVLGLTWDCVDFQANTLYINKQLQKTKKVGGTYLLVPTKNGKGRTITAAPSVMAVLKKQKTRQAQMRLAAGPAWENKDGLVFTNEFGGHLAHFTVYKDFKAICAGNRAGTGEVPRPPPPISQAHDKEFLSVILNKFSIISER